MCFFSVKTLSVRSKLILKNAFLKTPFRDTSPKVRWTRWIKTKFGIGVAGSF